MYLVFGIRVYCRRTKTRLHCNEDDPSKHGGPQRCSLEQEGGVETVAVGVEGGRGVRDSGRMGVGLGVHVGSGTEEGVAGVEVGAGGGVERCAGWLSQSKGLILRLKQTQ